MLSCTHQSRFGFQNIIDIFAAKEVCNTEVKFANQ